MKTKKKKYRVVEHLNGMNSSGNKSRRMREYSSAIDSGVCLYDHGVLVYCDDGNGNEWHYGDDESYMEEVYGNYETGMC